MKHIIIASLFLLVLIPASHSQQNPQEKFQSFSNTVIPRFNTYFSKAELTETGQLKLFALEKYNALALSSKNIIMDQLVKEWQESLITVYYNSKKELWGFNNEKSGALLVYSWDSNARNISNTATSASKTSKHPFFVYVGGQGVLDSEHNLNAAINTRVGFFLLKNRWDLAWVFSGGMVGNIDASMSNQLSTGLMSKFYFPIPKLNISPNVGVDLLGTVYIDAEGNDSQAASRSILAGIAWYIGPGSLDAGVRIKREPSVTVGYTLMPGQLGKKRNR